MKNPKKEFWMKLVLLTLLAAVFMNSAHADEIRHLKVYRDSVRISALDTHIKMTDVKWVMIPKVIRIVPRPCNSDSESDCTSAEIIKKVPAVQVNVEYRDGVIRDENSYKTVDIEFNLPVSAFTEEQIATLKEASRFSLSGRNKSIRKNFMHQNLKLEVTKFSKATRVLDEDRSTLCEGEYIWERTPGCVEDRKYKTKNIHYKHIKVSVN